MATETLYAVRVVTRPEDDGCPSGAFFGYEPTVYADRDEAEARAKLLSETGDWGEVGPPEYYVEEITEEEMTPFDQRRGVCRKFATPPRDARPTSVEESERLRHQNNALGPIS